jgi:hypothetical protein
MGAVLFLVGFLATGLIGAKTLGSFEIEPGERIGAEAFLFLPCVGTSVISILSYLQGSRGFHRYPGRIAGLAGGAMGCRDILCRSRRNLPWTWLRVFGDSGARAPGGDGFRLAAAHRRCA